MERNERIDALKDEVSRMQRDREIAEEQVARVKALLAHNLTGLVSTSAIRKALGYE